MSPVNSPTGLLLDTHIWVDFINGDPGLKRATAEAIEEARHSDAVYISVISVWEIAFLARKGKLTFPFGPLPWVEQAMRLPGMRMVPLSPEVAIRSVDLPVDLNKDPSDRFLVATAELEHLRFVTRDKDVIRFAKKFKIPVLNA